MSLFFGQERRDFGDGHPIPPNSERGRLSIRRVDLSTAEAGMQKIAVASSVRLIASAMTMLPLYVYSGEGEAKRRISTPRWLDDLGADGQGLEDWMWRGVYSWGLRGNIVGTVTERDTVTGKPRGVDMHHPDDVSVAPSKDGPVWRFRGKEIPRDLVFHRRIFPVPGCIMGASPIAQHALTIGTGIAAEQFGAQFFLDGGHPTALFQNTKKALDPAATKKVKDRFLAITRGNREPLVLGADWEYKALSVNPNDSQFLETNKYSSAESARIYGPGMPEMLGYETGGSMTYANIEQRSLDLLTFTLDPWFVRMEKMLSWLLPAPQYVKLERKALLRTDVLTRFRVHEIAVRNELETVNEIRLIEDLPPVAWGDERPTAKTAAPVPVQMEG